MLRTIMFVLHQQAVTQYSGQVSKSDRQSARQGDPKYVQKVSRI